MRRLAAIPALCLAALCLTATAQAEITFEKSFGGSGKLGGQFSTPAGVAVNNATGNVYVDDYGQNRVEQFTAAGKFVRAWGYDVVLAGTDNKPSANEADEVRIRATSGSFVLTFKGKETAQLPFNATAEEVQSALNALSTISEGGGSVTVTGGPGDLTGSTPYLVTFGGGPLAQTDVTLTLDSSGLGLPIGAELACEGGPRHLNDFVPPPEGFEYQWLANGVEIPGATSPTLTLDASEEGKAVQCRVTAIYSATKTVGTSRPYVLASPTSAPLPPLGPTAVAEPTGHPVVESLGGTSLKCQAGSWSRGPETFTYQWYRNGAPIGSSTTTVATDNEYVLTPADVATRAVFQCAVTGNNAGGSSTAFSQLLNSDPKPESPFPELATAAVTVAPGASSQILTRTNGGPVFEVCKGPPSLDECKAGVSGASLGQFNAPRSIAVDNSPGGNGAVYVIDDGNPRVQKFSFEGTPLLAFGKGVDQTIEGDVCTAASGHVCGPGIRATGGEPVAFGVWPQPGAAYGFDEFGNELAVDPLGHVYVGDPRVGIAGERIQKFDSGGTFISQAKVPPTLGRTGRLKPISIGVDSSEQAYASIGNALIGGAERFSAGEFSASGEGTDRQENVFDQNRNPAQIAMDPRNDRILISDRNTSNVFSVCGGEASSSRAIVEFDPQLNEIDCSVPTGPGNLPQVTGMAVSSAGKLYAATGSGNTIKIFKLPESKAPTIGTESATEITTETARLHAQINPGFEDTSYRIEYGLEDCSASECESVEGGTLRGLKFTDGSVPIAGLQPNTTYHYRAIAENPLGTVEGPDRTFTTFAKVDLVNDPCPNALARKQSKTVGLLDCRAYELASAAFTGGYDVVSDIVPGQEPFNAYPDAQGKLLYGVKDGGIPGTGNPTNRGIDPYVATRNEDGTWSTEYVGIPSDNPFATSPFSSTLLGSDSALDTFAFGGPNICNPCFADGSSGVPLRLPNGELTQGMTGSEPDPSAKAAGYVAKSLSPDGSHLVFGSTAKLEPTANEGGDATLYSRDLSAASTEVISTDEAGNTLSGAEVGELDLSTDGSRILVAQQLTEDANENPLWHLFLHRSGDSHSTDLTPGTTSGAYFDGMTQDGTKVFFTTKDQLLEADEDESADIYEAEVNGEGSLSLRLISTDSEGNASNDDSCEPPNTPDSWNSPEGGGKCSALAFAGGAGIAEESGDFYFLSPEQLQAGEGIPDMPNLYLVQPDGSPRFVATIDTSEGKAPPPPPNHPLADSEFGNTTFTAVEALTVDQSNGDLYALDAFGGSVYRFDSAGAPREFTAGPHTANALTGFSFGARSNAQAAVDNSPSALSGDLYVTAKTSVKVFAPSGEELGALNGAGTNKGSFTEACGVAVDQSSGKLYVADRGGFIWQYTPNSPTAPLADADYTVKGITAEGMAPCALAVGTAGNLYAAEVPANLGVLGGPVKQFAAASFATGSPPKLTGTEIASQGSALAADPVSGEVYVDEGDKVAIFDSAGNLLSSFGSGDLECGFLRSRGVALNATTHHAYASCFEPSVVKEFGYQLAPYSPVDNPAVLHAAGQPGAHDFSDFQVTPEGAYAAFASGMALKEGYDNASHLELYRYAPEGEELTCVSCSPTGSQAQGDAALPSHGLGLLEDGRVFFNSPEQLTLSDTNGKLDAYEFEDGRQQLISTGTSAHPSGMLGASRNGTDAFFFTRETLVPEDKNGEAMKLYDARAGGGNFVVPPPPPCAASDECHGPSSQSAPPPQIGTLSGTGGQYEERPHRPSCHKPKVRRHGRCVAPHKHKARKHHRAGRGK